jgi:RNAse (barnase) inhibitor barstar
MKRIEFLKKPSTYFNEAEFLAYLSKVENENDLFSKLSNVLKFPDYFGDNWNALYDCLRDFNWIEKEGIALIHTEMPNLSEEGLKTYVEILFDTVQDWKEDEEHYFKVIFPEETEQTIKKLISSFQ